MNETEEIVMPQQFITWGTFRLGTLVFDSVFCWTYQLSDDLPEVLWGYHICGPGLSLGSVVGDAQKSQEGWWAFWVGGLPWSPAMIGDLVWCFNSALK